MRGGVCGLVVRGKVGGMRFGRHVQSAAPTMNRRQVRFEHGLGKFRVRSVVFNVEAGDPRPLRVHALAAIVE